MSKQHLAKYVEGKNWARRLFGEPQLDVNNLTARDITELLDRIEGDLSPENLTCDGELRGAKLKAKHTMILGAQRELMRLAGQPA